MGEILNERQYRITKSWLRKFEQNLGEAKTNPDGLSPRMHRAILESLQSQIDDFKRELAEYETLKVSSPEELTLKSLEELPMMLVKMRIVRGLTQRELAERMNLKEQQIQRYEAERYQNASYQRILEVAQALNVDVQPTAFRNSNTI